MFIDETNVIPSQKQDLDSIHLHFLKDNRGAGHREIRRAVAADLGIADVKRNLAYLSNIRRSLRVSHQHKRRPQKRMRERNAALACAYELQLRLPQRFGFAHPLIQILIENFHDGGS